MPAVLQELSDPTTRLEEKHEIIRRVFPAEIRELVVTLTDRGEIDLLTEIVKQYRDTLVTDVNETSATLFYVTAPSTAQENAIKAFISRKTGREDLKLVLREDKSLGDGFILRIGTEEYDWSMSGRISQLKERFNRVKDFKSSENIVDILKGEAEEFELKAIGREIGYVKWVGDGIARLDGIEHAVYGEIVQFDNGVKGMVLDIKRDSIGCILFGREEDIREGTRVIRTGAQAGIPVGAHFLGRVIDALGAPIDGGGPVKTHYSRPVENPAPGIVDRKSVSVPLETGILAIDSMFPIGRGQRELIIGDRQTGKTSIAIETIINQKGRDVICVYVAIGQKASTVAKVVGILKKNGCMDYTVVVCSTASDPAPMQYIAPYSATAMAEYFMSQGRDVLIVYDDLSKHAVAYRTISLLLERPPGREAYPGDVFYLHSRLLERSSRLSEKRGGGSITALPIIETQSGDVSAYIPTNVISITDGQIYLESDLFFEGQRPAVNVGLSVSRVGGAAQTSAMKSVAGTLRLNLAQYREMAVFTQFSSELDQSTKELLTNGRVLMELLKQPLESPLSMSEQVVTLLAANEKVFSGIPPEKTKQFQAEMLEYMHEHQEKLLQSLERRKELTEDLRERLLNALRGYRANHGEYT
ncbi:MAG: F0F1 ATP synthase subunit alpha [Lachnospiraceae bacterium]|nr:F0F1 ATP synthase subunit alpha [Lachnospiraceae bacterium]